MEKLGGRPFKQTTHPGVLHCNTGSPRPLKEEVVVVVVGGVVVEVGGDEVVELNPLSASGSIERGEDTRGDFISLVVRVVSLLLLSVVMWVAFWEVL